MPVFVPFRACRSFIKSSRQISIVRVMENPIASYFCKNAVIKGLFEPLKSFRTVFV